MVGGSAPKLLPEMITLDDWGFPIVRTEEVPPGLLRQAREVVRIRPLLALRLGRRRAGHVSGHALDEVTFGACWCPERGVRQSAHANGRSGRERRLLAAREVVVVLSSPGGRGPRVGHD